MVMADGSVSYAARLHKDKTGYDLKQILSAAKALWG